MKSDNFNFGLLPSGCVFGWVWWPSGCCGENIANNASDASLSPRVNVAAAFVHHAISKKSTGIVLRTCVALTKSMSIVLRTYIVLRAEALYSERT